MAKKDKKEMVEEVEEEVLEEEPVPEPTPEPEPVQQGRIEKKRVEGIGFTLITYDNGEFEKVYN
jgi:hypothetical protein|tara:strand:- start:11 stop:202 length:192 start_codon:yes stop_codon:yes gene_type:complete